MDYGPIVAAVAVTTPFQAYKGGVFNVYTQAQINHGVVIVGWDDTRGANGAWIIRNSWSESWGEQGYMYIEYGCSKIGYRAAYIVYGSTPPSGETIMLPGNVPLELVRIPAGRFQMGSPDTERSRLSVEGPVHPVTIAYDFYLGKYEVTQAQWLAVMGSWPGTEPSSDFGLGDNYPAYNISWNDARNFITALNTHITATRQGPATMRLPSETEWEYACRAGTQERFYFGDSLGVGDECEYDRTRSLNMWYCGNNSPDGSKPVGGKLPNAFGLYDMSGNLWEWCEDDWHGTYTGTPADGSPWVSSPRTSYRAYRSGNWGLSAGYCRSAHRAYNTTATRYFSLGFRLASVR